MQHVKMKEKIRKEYYRRVNPVLQTKLIMLKLMQIKTRSNQPTSNNSSHL